MGRGKRGEREGEGEEATTSVTTLTTRREGRGRLGGCPTRETARALARRLNEREGEKTEEAHPRRTELIAELSPRA